MATLAMPGLNAASCKLRGHDELVVRRVPSAERDVLCPFVIPLLALLAPRKEAAAAAAVVEAVGRRAHMDVQLRLYGAEKTHPEQAVAAAS